MNINYLTLRACFMRAIVFTILLSFLFLKNFGQCDSVSDKAYIEYSKKVYAKNIKYPNDRLPVNFTDSKFSITCYNPEDNESSTMYYEFKDGTYSINKEDNFFSDIQLEQLKINYRYIGGDKPKHIVANGRTAINLSKRNLGYLRENKLSIDFSNPNFDLFREDDEHIIIIDLPNCTEGCSLEVDLNSNTDLQILEAVELRDYLESYQKSFEGDRVIYEYNGKERLVFLQVKTTKYFQFENNIQGDNELPDMIKVVADISEGNKIKKKSSLALNLLKSGDPLDPNAIEVDKICITLNELYDEKLVYTLHFENMGNAPSVNVYIDVFFPNGVIPPDPNDFNKSCFNRSATLPGIENIKIEKITSKIYRYTIKYINLSGIQKPLHLRQADFQFVAKTQCAPAQFGTYAEITFEGENQITGTSLAIKPVRTNDATTTVCGSCLNPKELLVCKGETMPAKIRTVPRVDPVIKKPNIKSIKPKIKGKD